LVGSGQHLAPEQALTNRRKYSKAKGKRQEEISNHETNRIPQVITRTLTGKVKYLPHQNTVEPPLWIKDGNFIDNSFAPLALISRKYTPCLFIYW
jgi:hypothetical protein